MGRVIGDRYRLLAPIAEGLASSVFKAEHVRMGKALCIKVLRGPLARDPELAARFRTEARVVSRLSHPHTIAVFDFGELEGNEGFYLAMEYLHGENLFDVLRREGRLPWSRAAAIGEQLLGALGEAHEAGIVHRDVKPANVMLLQPKNDADFVKLLDFGIAEIEGQGPGGGLGTPTYLSPEQARGAAPDARSDLYSLGVLLYEMVGGRPPFVAPNPMAVLSAHLHEEPAPLARLCPEVSPAFAAVVHRALAKRPEERFESADAMRIALRAAAVRGEPAGSPTGRSPPPRSPGSSRSPAGSTSRPLPGPGGRTRAGRCCPGPSPSGSRWRCSSPQPHPPGRAHRRRGGRAERRPGRGRGAGTATPVAGPGAPEHDRGGRHGAGATGGGDVDTFAVEPHARGREPDAVLLVPQKGLALDLMAWVPRGGGSAGPRGGLRPPGPRGPRGARAGPASPGRPSPWRRCSSRDGGQRVGELPGARARPEQPGGAG